MQTIISWSSPDQGQLIGSPQSPKRGKKHPETFQTVFSQPDSDGGASSSPSLAPVFAASLVSVIFLRTSPFDFEFGLCCSSIGNANDEDEEEAREQRRRAREERKKMREVELSATVDVISTNR